MGKWDYYFHLPFEKAWDLASYRVLHKQMAFAEEVLFVAELVHENLIKRCMFFVMRAGITPQWEDPKNRDGGCFSFKIQFKLVHSIWRDLLFAACGERLFLDKRHHALLTGITISPKKNFCIVKIWLCNCTLQDPESIAPIRNLTIAGCLFKKHEPEF